MSAGNQKQEEEYDERWQALLGNGHCVYAAGGGDCHIQFWRVPNALGRLCVDRGCRPYRRVHACHRRVDNLGSWAGLFSSNKMASAPHFGQGQQGFQDFLSAFVPFVLQILSIDLTLPGELSSPGFVGTSGGQWENKPRDRQPR